MTSPLRPPSPRGIVRAAMKTRIPLKPLSVTLASALAVVMVPGCATVEPTPASAAPAGQSGPQAKVVRGSIVYREKVALPTDAEIVVQLLDVTRPERPVPNATVTLRVDGRQVPIPFALPIDPAKVTGRLHALHATIRFGGKTQFVTGARVNIDPASPPQSIVMTVVPGEDDRIVEDAPAPVPRAGQTPPPPGMIPPRGQPPVR